jgi:RNA polymerase sigma-70 factor (ECF subfamily)
MNINPDSDKPNNEQASLFESPTAEMMDEFIKLYSQNQTRINIYVRSLVTNASTAEEIIQETNYILWREFSQFQIGSNFLAWACTIAYNQMLAWRKKQQREKLVFSDTFLQAVNDELSSDFEGYEERRELLLLCIEKLPKHHREMIRHRYTLGEGVERMAEELGKTVTSIYRMLSRIRESLHQCVDLQQRNKPK